MAADELRVITTGRRNAPVRPGMAADELRVSQTAAQRPGAAWHGGRRLRVNHDPPRNAPGAAWHGGRRAARDDDGRARDCDG